jgi:hypothetical protein
MPNEVGRHKQPTLHELSSGVRVEVRGSFEGTWSSGFEIAEVVLGDDGGVAYRLRRLSDGTVLPVVFPLEDIIPTRG